ncbi:MAG: glycosyltransferase, partial [Vicinamibacteria bacterium]
VQHVSRKGFQVRVLSGGDASALPSIRDYSPNIIVNDLPFLDEAYLRSLSKLGASTVNFVDTLADIENPAAMAAIIIAALADEQAELEDYHVFPILRDSFLGRRGIIADSRRVVLSFGGSDPQKLTLKALSALNFLADLEVTAVLGPAFSHGPELDELLERLRYRPRILKHVEHMADILAEAELVLCSGGMTVFEIAALGRPGVVLCQNAKEEARMRRFEREGSILHLGLGTEVEEIAIHEKVMDLLNDRAARQRMSEAGVRLVEGGGAKDAAEEILKAGTRGPANGGRRE